jgi:ABC-2 type transport system ATP-binding protein
MIEARSLTKRYDDKLAVDALSFTIRPGIVTGFLGPNGAGKSTTMRMMMGLDRPSSGTVRINGKPYAEHAAPLNEVGALLEARAVHPGRSARNHLLSLALTSGIQHRRVDQVLDMVGLAEVAHKRVGGFSLGMGQRLGVAAALLGDPGTLILDEPVNGLDLDGIRWIRALLTRLAGEGRTVFLSSHLMSEMAMTAEHVIVIGKGRLLRDQPMADFIREASVESVRVLSPQGERLAGQLRSAGATVTVNEADPDGITPGRHGEGPVQSLIVEGVSSREVGTLAARSGITLWELAPQAGSLEDAYLALTRDALDFQDAEGAPMPGPHRTPASSEELAS